jgi:hypothetical protein
MVIFPFAVLSEPQNQFGLSMRGILTPTVPCVARRAHGLTMKPLIFMVGI